MRFTAHLAAVALASLICISVGTSRAQTPIPPQPASIRALDWHPDGSLLARVFQNGTLEVVDTTMTPEFAVFTFSNGIAPASALRWSHSGDQLAAGIGNNVHVWDFSDSNRHIVLSGHTAPILSLTWRANDLELASLSEEAPDNFRLWDLANEQERLASTLFQTYSLDWRANTEDEFIVAVTGIALGRIDPADGSIERLNEESGLIPSANTGIAWNPLSSQFAVSSVLGQVIVFDADGTFVALFEPDERVRINAVSWAPNSQYIISADEAGFLRVWSLSAGQQVVEVIDTGEDAIFAVDWNPVTNEIAYGGVSGSTGIFVPDLEVDEVAVTPSPTP
jgi:WD40 repeat protein